MFTFKATFRKRGRIQGPHVIGHPFQSFLLFTIDRDNGRQFSLANAKSIRISRSTFPLILSLLFNPISSSTNIFIHNNFASITPAMSSTVVASGVSSLRCRSLVQKSCPQEDFLPSIGGSEERSRKPLHTTIDQTYSKQTPRLRPPTTNQRTRRNPHSKLPPQL